MAATRLAVLVMAMVMALGARQTEAIARFGTVFVDGSADEWDFASTEFDTSARPCASNRESME
jgi:hypothetical protein